MSDDIERALMRLPEGRIDMNDCLMAGLPLSAAVPAVAVTDELWRIVDSRTADRYRK
jgi:hypothetical protein